MSFVDFTIMVAGILVVLLIVGFVLAIRSRGSDLLRHGLAGTGIILSVQQTQEKVGSAPVAKVLLDVTPDLGPGFQAIARQVISPSNSYLFEPGRQVPVRYDQTNRSKIIVVTDK